MPRSRDVPREIRDPATIPLSEVFSGRHSTAERIALRFLVNYCNPRASVGDFEQDLNSLTVADIKKFEVMEYRDKHDKIGTRRYEILDKRTGTVQPLVGVAAGTIETIQKRLTRFGHTFDFKKG
jgi:hypothetical protein